MSPVDHSSRNGESEEERASRHRRRRSDPYFRDATSRGKLFEEGHRFSGKRRCTFRKLVSAFFELRRLICI